MHPATHRPVLQRPSCLKYGFGSWQTSRHTFHHQRKPVTSSGAQKQAIVIVDHGSRRPESNRQLEDFVALYRKMYDQEMAVAAHMEIAEPSIEDAINQCVQQGFEEIVVAPYFLSQGRHIQQDIPALVSEAAAAHPGVRCIIADPIGIDSMVADIIHERVASAAAKAPSEPS